MIDVRFETLIKVAEEKNFTKAAMALNLTQPCVSHHISSCNRSKCPNKN